MDSCMNFRKRSRLLMTGKNCLQSFKYFQTHQFFHGVLFSYRKLLSLHCCCSENRSFFGYSNNGDSSTGLFLITAHQIRRHPITAFSSLLYSSQLLTDVMREPQGPIPIADGRYKLRCKPFLWRDYSLFVCFLKCALYKKALGKPSQQVSASI